MPTKSILKDVDIKEKHQARNLVEALEKASCDKQKRCDGNVLCGETSRDNLKKIYG